MLAEDQLREWSAVWMTSNKTGLAVGFPLFVSEERRLVQEFDSKH